MTNDSTDAAWAAARAAELDGMTREEVARLLGDVRIARSCLDAIEMRAARRVRELESVGLAEPADSMIATAGGRSGRSGRDARAVTARERLCDAMPQVEEAFAGGTLTAAHLDAIAAATKDLPLEVRDEYATMAAALVNRADRVSIDGFGRECRELARDLLARARRGGDVDELAAGRAASKLIRWVDRTTGMHHTHLELDPLRDAKLGATMNRELARLRQASQSSDREWQQLQVDAFVNAIAGISTLSSDPTSVEHEAEGGCRGNRAGRVDRVPEITALVSYEWLSGLAEDGVCETERGEALPISTMRRVCCDAEIIPAVLGGDAEVLDHGRSRRTVSRAQRRALRSMHRGCAHPDCSVGFDACRIHHITWWWRDLGPTDIANLLPLCERHHHLVHEGGWTLTMTPARVATWLRPDGSLHHGGATIDRSPPGGRREFERLTVRQ